MEKMSNKPSYSGFEIAVIGMSCRFPGAQNWRTFWDNLKNGTESIRFYEEEELLNKGIKKEVFEQRGYVKAGVELEGKENFDASFFEYRAEEAALMHPANRIFHECVWEALEDACINPEEISEPIGLFAGGGDDFNWKAYSALENVKEKVEEFSLWHINNMDFLSSLVSYKLNLKGPAVCLNTACSTSLVAVHMACRSLLFGESKIAIAGGVSIHTDGQLGYAYQEGMINSRDGHCRAFDKDSSGTIGGEGSGVVVLKRLKDALKDGDQIHAIIKGSAVNNDGKGKVGFTAPSVTGQAKCIKMAHSFSKINPSSISYIEAHGTGTNLGDPVELEALNVAFSNSGTLSCAIGSVKTNFGHLDAAAGIAGLIKVVLSLKHRQLPPSLNFSSPNPFVNFGGGPFHIQTKLTAWTPKDSEPLRAGVSSFGVGGTNAHIILEEAPENPIIPLQDREQLLLVSSVTGKGLSMNLQKTLNFVIGNPELNLSDLVYTMGVGRKHFGYRKSLVFTNRQELIDSLQSVIQKPSGIRSKNIQEGVAFVFPGQGTQYVNVGLSLYENVAFFREEMNMGFALLKQISGIDFKEALYPSEVGEDLTLNTLYTQPVVYLFEHSLALYLIHLGINPRMMIGHSVGEYVAATLSGVFSFEEGLKLIFKRAVLMDKLEAGAMVSLSVTLDQAKKYVSEECEIAAVNGPNQIVLSGSLSAIGKLQSRLEAERVIFVRLNTSHAFHSYMMNSIMDEFEHELKKITFGKIVRPFISNLSGKWITQEEASSPEYWVLHMRKTVLFSDCINELVKSGECRMAIEVGGGHTLTGLIKQFLSGEDSPIALISLISGRKTQHSASKNLLDGLGKVWSGGINLNWSNYFAKEKHRRISAPTYSFEPVKFPVIVDPFSHELLTSGVRKDSNTSLKDWIYLPGWKSTQLVQSSTDVTRKTYLFFSTGSEWDNKLSSFLVEKGEKVILVYPGNGYERQTSGAYLINPEEEGDFRHLIKELKSGGEMISDLLYSWSALASPMELTNKDVLPDIRMSYLYLGKILKYFGAEKWKELIRVGLLTDGIHNLDGTAIGNEVQSMILSFVNTIPQEFTFLCSNIDLPSDKTDPRLLTQVYQELKALGKEKTVALRYGKRWVPEFELNETEFNVASSLLKKEGIYMVTGGLGDLGFVLAKYLARKYKARLVLTGRKTLPQEEEESEAGERIRELAAYGSEVKYYSVDCTDLEGMRKVVDIVKQEMGSINGIIHTAGVNDHRYFESIADLSVSNTMTLIGAKVMGTMNLHSIIKDEPVDFVWMSSSLSSLLGGLTYTSYSAGNIFMDHFCRSRAADHTRWRSVCIGEMLMSEIESEIEIQGKRTAMVQEEICQLFEWSLSQNDFAVLFQSVGELKARIIRSTEALGENAFDRLIKEDMAQVVERSDLSTAFVAPESIIEVQMIGMIEKFLGINGIGVLDDFFELGGDSLRATVLLRRIEREHDIYFPISEFFQCKNIRELTVSVEEKVRVNKKSERKYSSII
jgi:phthiocerol/phenolphthiocerol synthesis type-I polyketide synthase E